MADKKISALTAATTPLAGTEVLPIVQGGATVKVSVDNLTTGKPVSMSNLTYTGTATGGTGVINIGSGQVYKDASGNVGIGTIAPVYKLNVVASDETNTVGGSAAAVNITNSNTSGFGKTVDLNFSVGAGVVAEKIAGLSAVFTNFSSSVGGALAFCTNDGSGSYAERARIDASGNVLVNTASQIASGKVSVASAESAFTAKISGNTGVGVGLDVERTVQNGDAAYFRSTTGLAGFITITGANTCTYNSVSDYRLKENVVPMTGALEKVAALKPCTYTWKTDGSNGQGFIAHELQAVVPDCVTGEKDAVQTVDDLDADGKKIGTKEVPRYQGVDTSVLVATLVAAIQEQQALITQLQADVSALKGS